MTENEKINTLYIKYIEKFKKELKNQTSLHSDVLYLKGAFSSLQAQLYSMKGAVEEIQTLLEHTLSCVFELNKRIDEIKDD